MVDDARAFLCDDCFHCIVLNTLKWERKEERSYRSVDGVRRFSLIIAFTAWASNAE